MKVAEMTSITDNIDSFADHINSSYKPWPGYMFRGQANSNWPIESSLKRHLSHFTPKERTIEEIRQYERFRKNIRGKRGDNPNTLSDIELKALGQHYGLYTTLVDWTRSPYVALFFALSNCSEGNEFCSVYCLNTDIIDEVNESNIKIDPTMCIELVEPEDDYNKRIVNQSGLFLDIPLAVDFNSWLNNAQSYECVMFEQINISTKLKNDGLLLLDQMNISYNSLFPDLEGAANDANLRLELRKYVEKRQNEAWGE